MLTYSPLRQVNLLLGQVAGGGGSEGEDKTQKYSSFNDFMVYYGTVKGCHGCADKSVGSNPGRDTCVPEPRYLTKNWFLL